mgnify:CR=1 FL=1
MKSLVKFLLLSLFVACSANGLAPSNAGPTDSDVVVETQPTAVKAIEKLVSPPPPPVPVIPKPTSPVPVPVPTPPEPETLAERFVAAGGVKLCEAFVKAMSPEWGLDLCAQKVDPVNRQQCVDSRKPLLEFATQICVPIVEDSLHFNVDPGMIVAVYENESNLGRVRFNRWTKTYWIGTDIRPPAYRDAGETGLPQLLPPNYRSGTCVGPLNIDGSCNGEVLRGTQFDRRAMLIEHPEWQVRLGVREIAKHRDICVAYSDRVEVEDFWTFIGMYNTGKCKQDPRVNWSRWVRYTLRVMRHYLTACTTGRFVTEDRTEHTIAEVWDECARVQEALPRLQRQQ